MYRVFWMHETPRGTRDLRQVNTEEIEIPFEKLYYVTDMNGDVVIDRRQYWRDKEEK